MDTDPLGVASQRRERRVGGLAGRHERSSMAVRRAAVAWAVALAMSCGLLAAPLVVFAATSAVTIQNSAFNPPSTTVRVGDTITWTNRDAISHTATSDTGAWDTGVITAGASRSITFMTAGTFLYHCAIHAFMKGTVVVQAVTTPPPPTPPPTAPPTVARTAPPTVAPAPPTPAPATVAPTEAPAASPSELPSPSATASASAPSGAGVSASVSPSAVAVQVTPRAVDIPGGPGPVLIGVAVLAILGLGAIAFVLARRS
ncbi:MAG: hypothetical protein E6J13_05405 [Chloroflexi bacterium]|nr:MAG: hypothetical protein E6J13_05405 [Chloroflexota bacterium]